MKDRMDMSVQSKKSNISRHQINILYHLFNLFEKVMVRFRPQKVLSNKEISNTEVWREATLTLAILKYPNEELRQSIESFIAHKQGEWSLTDNEFKLYVNALQEHASFKGIKWINNEYKKSRDLNSAKNFLKYAPLDKI